MTLSPIDNVLYFLGIPLLILALLAARFLTRKGAHPPTYQLSESWAQTHPPILWAAVDEVVGGHGHDTAPFSVGGGASGKW